MKLLIFETRLGFHGIYSSFLFLFILKDSNRLIIMVYIITMNCSWLDYYHLAFHITVWITWYLKDAWSFPSKGASYVGCSHPGLLSCNSGSTKRNDFDRLNKTRNLHVCKKGEVAFLTVIVCCLAFAFVWLRVLVGLSIRQDNSHEMTRSLNHRRCFVGRFSTFSRLVMEQLSSTM